MDLSIVIVNWNTRDLLASCLQAILNNNHISIDNYQSDRMEIGALIVEVIVVDNNSTDGSSQMVSQNFPWVQLVENSKNIGFASANNQAIQQCSGRYVLLLNPDTEMRSDLLQTLVQFMDTHSDVGAVGPRTLNPDGSLQTSCYPAPTLSRELWRLLHLDAIFPYGSYRMTDWNLSQPRVVGGLQGSCLLLRRAALDQVGLLDERYFIYSEEVDLCYRLQQAGWQLYWVPQAQIVHYGGQSTQQAAEKMFLQLYRGKLIYFRKHYGWLAGQIYKLILLIAALLRILLSPLVWLQPPSHRQRHFILARNYKKLVRTLPGM